MAIIDLLGYITLFPAAIYVNSFGFLKVVDVFILLFKNLSLSIIYQLVLFYFYDSINSRLFFLLTARCVFVRRFILRLLLCAARAHLPHIVGVHRFPCSRRAVPAL